MNTITYSNKISFELNNILSNNTNQLSKCIERLSTGWKINGAEDDPADYAIATNLETEISSLDIAQDNITQGTNMLSVAEDSLNTIIDILSRIKNLALEASNGTYEAKSLNAIQLEINACSEQIESIQKSTSFNDISLFQTTYVLNKNSSYIDSNGVLTEISNNASVSTATAPVPAITSSGYSKSATTNTVTPLIVSATLVNNISADTEELLNSTAIQTNETTTQNNNITVQTDDTTKQIDYTTIQTADELLTTTMDNIIPAITKAIAAKSLMMTSTLSGSGNTTTVVLDAHEAKSLTIGDFTYSITNLSDYSNTIYYTYDTETGQITFDGGNYSLTSTVTQNDNLVISSSGNVTINVGAGNNIIQLNSGNNISVSAGNGNNSIVTQVAANITLGNGTNDVTLNAQNSNIVLGSGTNTLNINALNTIINSSGQSDTINTTSDKSFTYNNLLFSNGTELAVQNSASGMTLNAANYNISTTTSAIRNILLYGDNITYTDSQGTSTVTANGMTE